MKQKFQSIPGILTGTVMGFALAGVAFVIIPDITKNIKNLSCPEWIGFCKDETKSESSEKIINNQRTNTTQIQSGKTVWDWLELAGLLAIPVLLITLGNKIQHRDQKRSHKQAVLTKEIASVKLRDEALENYFDRMSELLLDKNLRNSSDEAVKDIAITRTLTILRRLENDSDRKTAVIRFLDEAEILPIIKGKFKGVNLSGANLNGTNLSLANLNGADLTGADLTGADLTGADLNGANLSKADLPGADLPGAALYGANLYGANLSLANLYGANLSLANLSKADFSLANLSKADFSLANFSLANLSKANFYGANLSKVQDLIFEQIKSACYWEEAIYSEAQRHENLYRWVARDEEANQERIKAIKLDLASDPKKPVDCSYWSKK